MSIYLTDGGNLFLTDPLDRFCSALLFTFLYFCSPRRPSLASAVRLPFRHFLIWRPTSQLTTSFLRSLLFCLVPFPHQNLPPVLLPRLPNSNSRSLVILCNSYLLRASATRSRQSTRSCSTAVATAAARVRSSNAVESRRLPAVATEQQPPPSRTRNTYGAQDRLHTAQH